MSSEPNKVFEPIQVFDGNVGSIKVRLITEPGLTLRARFEHAPGIDPKDHPLKLSQIITASIEAAGGRIINKTASNVSPTFQVMPKVGKDILPTIQRTFQSLAEKTAGSNFDAAYEQIQTALLEARGRDGR